MTDLSTLAGGPRRTSTPMGSQRARVVKAPASLSDGLTVTLLAYSTIYEYEVPATQWISRGTALPVVDDVGAAIVDDHGDTWFIVGGGTEFPAGGGGGAPSGPAGGVLGGTYPDPTFAVDMATQAELDAHAADTTAVHGIADTSLLVVTSDARLTNARTPTAHHATHEPGGTDPMVVDAAAAIGSLRTLGTGATQAAAGNDARLSDQRTPTNGSVTDAKVASGAAIARSKLDFGSGLVNADIAAAAGIVKSKLGALAIVNADVDPAAAIAESKLNLATDAAAGTGSRRTLGTGAQQAAAGNDSRLSDARTPTAHKASHASGGSDALTGNLDAVGRTNVKKSGTTIGTRRGLNLIEGANITITVADDSANEEVDVTIAAAGGGAGPTFITGTGAPGAGTGSNGQMYLDTASLRIWGPKASGAWPGTALGRLMPLNPTYAQVDSG